MTIAIKDHVTTFITILNITIITSKEFIKRLIKETDVSANMKIENV